MPDNDEILDIKEAARYLKINDQTLRRFAREGRVPAFRLGQTWRFQRSSLDAWASSQRTLARRKSVLVVDDELVVRDTVGRMLADGGYRVRTARNGAQALDLMEQDLPDLVLLDLKMSGRDGPTTSKEIRQRWGRLPVIILTGYPSSELMNQALQYSPLTLLAKPVEPEVLLAAAAEALAVRQPAAAGQ